MLTYLKFTAVFRQRYFFIKNFNLLLAIYVYNKNLEYIL